MHETLVFLASQGLTSLLPPPGKIHAHDAMPFNYLCPLTAVLKSPPRFSATNTEIQRPHPSQETLAGHKDVWNLDVVSPQTRAPLSGAWQLSFRGTGNCLRRISMCVAVGSLSVSRSTSRRGPTGMLYEDTSPRVQLRKSEVLIPVTWRRQSRPIWLTSGGQYP